jgi:hypothetical protein
MASAKKNTTEKNKKKKVLSHVYPWNTGNPVQTLFPQKLARVNEMLKNAKMLS